MRSFGGLLVVAIVSAACGGAAVPSAASSSPAVASAVPTATAPVAVASAPVIPATRGVEQLRGYFVDAFGPGIYTPAQIDELVASAKAANMNAIFAQVVRRGDCFCDRSAVPRTDAGIAPLPFDPLETVIEKAHAQGIQVHAWMIVTGIWKGPAAPKDAAHPFNVHGLGATGTADWLTRRSDGLDRIGDEYFLDLGHPDAADQVVKLAVSIVGRYDVDGLNLDRIRYPDENLGTNVPSWGYNPTALARFQKETGRADRPAPTDAQWTQWRRDRVTDVVRRIYKETTALRPGIRISADTIAYGAGPQSQGGWSNTRTYAEVLQDWVGWMREGILDLNVPMLYKRDGKADQRKQYIEWNDFAKEQRYGRQVAIGTALYLNDIAASVSQVRTAIAPSSAGQSAIGWVGYSYRTPDETVDAGSRTASDVRTQLASALVGSEDAPFHAPALVPAMSWKPTR